MFTNLKLPVPRYAIDFPLPLLETEHCPNFQENWRLDTLGEADVRIVFEEDPSIIFGENSEKIVIVTTCTREPISSTIFFEGSL